MTVFVCMNLLILSLFINKIFSTFDLFQYLPQAEFPWNKYELDTIRVFGLALAFIMGNGTVFVGVMCYDKGMQNLKIYLLVFVVMFVAFDLTNLALNVVLFEALMVAMGFAIFGVGFSAFWISLFCIPCSLAYYHFYKTVICSDCFLPILCIGIVVVFLVWLKR